MCGIAGFNWEDKGLVKRMTSVLAHRGPDDSGFFVDNGVSLGQRRLSILDLSEKGKQPMFYSKKVGSCNDVFNKRFFNNACVGVVFNGEIYNFKEIRKELRDKGYSFSTETDTEVILASYLEWSFDCVNRFNGMWAFCIWDKQNKMAFLARDRLGLDSKGQCHRGRERADGVLQEGPLHLGHTLGSHAERKAVTQGEASQGRFAVASPGSRAGRRCFRGGGQAVRTGKVGTRKDHSRARGPAQVLQRNNGGRPREIRRFQLSAAVGGQVGAEERRGPEGAPGTQGPQRGQEDARGHKADNQSAQGRCRGELGAGRDAQAERSQGRGVGTGGPGHGAQAEARRDGEGDTATVQDKEERHRGGERRREDRQDADRDPRDGRGAGGDLRVA